MLDRRSTALHRQENLQAQGLASLHDYNKGAILVENADHKVSV